MLRPSREDHHLPADVVLSAREVSRAASRSDPELPAWLRRVLPKTGIAGQIEANVSGFDDAEDDPDLEEDDEEFFAGSAALAPVSFDVRAGEGLGLAGPDKAATLTLRQILTRTLPPSAG